MNYLFVYGTLKSPRIQKELLGKELKMQKASLIDFSLFEAQDGYYFVKESPIGEKVEGYLLEINDNDLKIFDAFELCPTMYERKNVKVEANNKLIEAYLYIRIDDVGKYKKVSDFSTLSRLSEDDVILEEIIKFKEIEHPEFYRK